MITYLVTRAHRYTVDSYVDGWKTPAGGIRVQTYEELLDLESLPDGPCIFTDMDRLGPEETLLVSHLWNRFQEASPASPLLNDPLRFLKRHDLLRSLYRAGWNEFQVYRATEAGVRPRFPVFLRHENEHDGGLTGLLESPRDLDRAFRDLRRRGVAMRDLLIVEFCDVSDGRGVFRKYSAFRIGKQILPRRLLFGSAWMVKNNSPELIGEETAREEKAFIQDNPHQAALREVFDLARIEYGRVDYGVRNGRVQIWEINTNPMIFLRPEKYHALSLPMQHDFASKIADALDALGCGGGGSVDIRFPANLTRAVLRVGRRRRRRRLGRHLRASVARATPRLATLLRRARGLTVPIWTRRLLAASPAADEERQK